VAVTLLKDVAHARSGDKGDISNICVFARDPRFYPALKRSLTVERVKEHFGPMVKGDVRRYDLDTLDGFNFVLTGALDGGATQSLRLDTLGKCMASALLRLPVDVDEAEDKS
jgi:hypothetical protein